jgi:hypothetical protein
VSLFDEGFSRPISTAAGGSPTANENLEVVASWKLPHRKRVPVEKQYRVPTRQIPASSGSSMIESYF